MEGIRKVLFLLAGGLAAPGVVTAAPPPVAAAADSRVIVVDGAEGDRFWIRTKASMQQPKYPPALMRAGVSGCVVIGFVIEPDGTPSGLRALTATTSARALEQRKASLGMFSQAAAVAASSIRYEPGPANPERTRGFAAIPYEFFAGTGASVPGCRIEDLNAFLAKRVGVAEAVPGGSAP